MSRLNKNQELQKPSRNPFSAAERLHHIDGICSTFVATIPSLRGIYRTILETLLPEGSGIPGPVVTREQLRAAVSAIKPTYKDPFRRVRELQGEEGIHGIIQNGASYQLVHLAVGAKRVPRKRIPHKVKAALLNEQGWRCAVCGKPITIDSIARFDPDHRVPRLRGGGNEDSNLQALCPACNNNKSAQCSNCILDCQSCSWAFPEKNLAPLLRPEIIERLNKLSRERNMTLNDVANQILRRALDSQ
jgi:5-methylcytosine-specific restriction endonuclease McrA